MLPGIVDSAVAAAGDGFDAGYQMPGGVWLDGSADYLSWTPSTSGNQKMWTTVIAVRRLELGRTQNIFSCTSYSGNDGIATLQFNADDKLQLYYDTSGTNPFGAINDRVYRDPNAFLIIIWAVDAANNSHRIWVNGVEETISASLDPPNFDYGMNRSGTVMTVGKAAWGSSEHAKQTYSFLAHFDGQYLDVDDFMEQDANGVWRMKGPSGLTYGTNGVWLDFADSADLGDDNSGNGNDWTLNSITSANATGDVASDPYACLNAITPHAATLTDQNLSGYGSNSEQVLTSTIRLPSTGKWAFQATKVADAAGDGSGSRWTAVGICEGSYPGTLAFNSSFAHMLSDSGWLIDAGTHTDEGAQIDDTDTVEILFDADAGTILFKHNGSNHHTAKTHSLTGDLYFAYSSYSSTRTFTLDFGQNGYTPSDGDYKTLKAKNLPEPTIKKGSDHFDAILWTGTGASNDRTGVDFQPGLAWVKKRNASASHALVDEVRGTSKGLAADDTSVENTDSNVTAFNSDGITLGTHTEVNNSSDTYVGWLWKGSVGSGVSNTDGTITATVSANVTAGFSIVSYTGTGVAATVGHGLNQAPELVIVKNRDTASNWAIQSTYMTASNYYMYLDGTAGEANGSGTWNAAATDTVFAPKTAAQVNNSGDNHIAYCFHSVEGYSKFGSYTGNGSADGPFVWCGFEPVFVMVKRTDSTGSWHLFDMSRNDYNPTNTYLLADGADAEVTSGSSNDFDLLSNGFKVLATAGQLNTNGGDYIFATFAKHPFGGENTTPALAV